MARSRGTLRRWTGTCLVAGMLCAAALVPAAGALGLTVRQVASAVDLSADRLATGQLPIATTVTDASGEPFAYLYEQYRLPVASEEIAETIKAAIVAIEDRRFYSHGGLDLQGTARAALSNVLSNGSPFEGQGGSTITMQYVKNYRLYAVADTERERQAAVADTLVRKLHEAQIAMRLEQRLSKQEILTRYLNSVYFGNGAYGIEAAARTYFEVPAAELTIAQAALLAGVVRSPTAFDPVDNPDAALARRGVVLDAMVDVGSVTPAQAAAAKAEPLGLQEPVEVPVEGCVGADESAGFFCRYLVEYLGAAGLTAEELRTGGYTIRTTMDREASRLADAAAEQGVPVERTEGIANAIAVVKPGRTEHWVVALAANLDFGLDAASGETAYPIPSAVIPHGAGSIYKIFTAAAAMARGVGVFDELPVPRTYTSRVFKNAGEPYRVQNYSDNYPSSLTLQEALATSPNTTFVLLEDRIGSIDPIVDMAYQLGMRSSLRVRDASGRTIAEAVKGGERASYTLGPEPTSPLDLANVAATIMSGGVWCPPTPLVSVTDRNGAPVEVPEAPCEQAVPEGLANSLAVALSEDTTYGTGAGAANDFGWERPMIGKTGTTQDSVSAAFLGATPQYAAAVMTWSDATPPRPVCASDPPRLCSDGTLFGATIPAHTWFAAMQPLHEDLPAAPLPEVDPEYAGTTAD